MSIAIVCANFGAIDKVHPLPASPHVQGFYYTDGVTLVDSEHSLGAWTVVKPQYPVNGFDFRLKSRYFKHQIHRLDEVQDFDWLVWIDSSIAFREVNFVIEEVRRLSLLPSYQHFLGVPHPQRDTVRQEYEFISGEIDKGNLYVIDRYGKARMKDQIAWFEKQGYNPDASGLYCGGFWIVANTDRYRRAFDDWWDQNLRFGLMDQLSLPMMLRKHGIEAQTLNVTITDNAHFHRIEHRRR